MDTETSAATNKKFESLQLVNNEVRQLDRVLKTHTKSFEFDSVKDAVHQLTATRDSLYNLLKSEVKTMKS